MNVGQAHLSGQAAQMNQVGGGGGGGSNGVIGGADGMPQHQQMQMQDSYADGMPHFVLMRNNMREKIYEYIGRKQTSADWRRRLPELARRLEEILFRTFPSKNEYFTMMKSPVEPQLQFAIKTLSAQNQQNQQNQQMSRQMASSSGYGTMIPTPGITQGAGGNSRMSYVTDNMGLSSSGAGMVPQNTNMGNSMPGADRFVWTKSSTNHYVPSSLESILQGRSRPHDIELQHLKQITDNFSDDRILGKGGSGVVYKGLFQNGDMIAVKKIMSSLMPGLQKQFETEVYHLMTLNHPNIVRCVGYCYEIKNACLEYNGKYVFAEMAEKLLCLEYLPKGSLDKYLSDESSGLGWSTRYKIIKGICYGLLYLHEQIDQPIIHLDMKPANILLDDSFIPKITDFGLSRQLDEQKTICTSTCDGTFGYMAPEFLHGGTITPKSDIFSLGVIIMEIVIGHRDYPDGTGASSDDFIKLTLEKWINVLQRSPGCGSLETSCNQIKRCVQVGLTCVNPDRNKRPPITEVISMLQGSESIDCNIRNEAV